MDYVPGTALPQHPARVPIAPEGSMGGFLNPPPPPDGPVVALSRGDSGLTLHRLSSLLAHLVPWTPWTSCTPSALGIEGFL
ncbi:unnamed protein product [Lota lota]